MMTKAVIKTCRSILRSPAKGDVFQYLLKTFQAPIWTCVLPVLEVAVTP